MRGIRKLTNPSDQTGEVYQGGAQSDAPGDTRVLSALGTGPAAWKLLPVSIRRGIAALPVDVLEALRTLLQGPPCPSSSGTEPTAADRASHR